MTDQETADVLAKLKAKAVEVEAARDRLDAEASALAEAQGKIWDQWHIETQRLSVLNAAIAGLEAL